MASTEPTSESTTKEPTKEFYIETIEGGKYRDFIPMNAIWTCSFGPLHPYSARCGQRNEDITNKICSKCGKERSFGATADLGQKTSSRGKRGKFWFLAGHDDDGSELWTDNFILD
ncbi:uncharacterized protein BKA55DRAFT_531816 [Fusarium redolens]|uniref:Uncharacterized protein n=1 Tax=Fusarium redolens TaxID=48865 RepID=A0A9P9KVI5_FUSRE|nr:uncharacterized protein BKA55DRAFT_531816 [Fusarium redolens]KAH7269150.1 hypothetical protein BKA55DRAFT_531816 [Fusarium redolens]